MSLFSSFFLCSLFVFFSRERDSLSFFLTFDLSILPSCLFFFFFTKQEALSSRARSSPPAPPQQPRRRRAPRHAAPQGRPPRRK